MLSQSKALASGIEAIKQGRYAEAVELLEMFCQLSQVSQEYWQAQIGLVEAYHNNGQPEKAIALRQKLLVSKNPQVQAWAQQTYAVAGVQGERVQTGDIVEEPSSTSTTVSAIADRQLLTPEQAEELLATGNKAIKFKRYTEAIEALEEFYHRTEPSTKHYSQAQMWLVKAYQGNEQLEEAIALCQQLINSDKEIVQAWARQFLSNFAPAAIVQAVSIAKAESGTTTAAEKVPDVGIKMKSLSELKSFYQQKLFTELKYFETKRKTVLKQIVIVGIVVLIVLFALVTFFPASWIDFSSAKTARTSFLIIFLFLLACVGCMWFLVAFYSSSTETYASGFKSKIIQQLINFIDRNNILSYAPYANTQTTLSAFQHSQIFQSIVAPSRISQDDCVSGTIGETDFFFSEICAEAEIAHDWLSSLNFTPYIFRSFVSLPIYMYVFLLIISIFKGAPYIIRRIVKGQRIRYQHFEEEILKNEVSRKTVFKGIFFRADFQKNFKGKTVILPGVLDYKIQLLNKGRGEVIKLEDPEFANLFMVYGNDQVEARYILSTSLMAKLVRFRKKARRNIYVSFVESRIYIAVEYAEDLFEPLLFKTMLSFAPIREYFEILQLMIGVVEELNLNRRIWSKE